MSKLGLKGYSYILSITFNSLGMVVGNTDLEIAINDNKHIFVMF